jgi:hypothetical protein
MVNVKPVYEIVIMIKIPYWYAKLYSQLESKLGWMENFICDLYAINQNVAEILLSLVSEY